MEILIEGETITTDACRIRIDSMEYMLKEENGDIVFSKINSSHPGGDVITIVPRTANSINIK